jgi:hypothetical protein
VKEKKHFSGTKFNQGTSTCDGSNPEEEPKRNLP